METEQPITIGKVTAYPRASTGKGVARKVRAQGMIPCVLYGGGKEAVPMTVDPVRLRKALDPLKMRNTLIELTVEGTGVVEQVMLKDYQIDVLRENLVHVDFVRVSRDKPVRVKVPLELEGRSVGVKGGGTLHKVFRQLDIECAADRIPSQVVGDVTALDIGDVLTIGQLATPEGVRVCLPANQTCALVFAPRKADLVEEGAAAAPVAEGEQPAEGAEPAPAAQKPDKKSDKKSDKK